MCWTTRRVLTRSPPPRPSATSRSRRAETPDLLSRVI
jgi:hypothetical protein